MDKQYLYGQLVKLGDMIGDGLHYESDGKWITKEYNQVARALGLIPKKKRASKSPEMVEKVNSMMTKRTGEVQCTKCAGQLKQSRSGSMRARCQSCGASFQLLKAVKAKRASK